MKRIIALVLSILMLLPLMFSCAMEEGKTNNNTAISGDAGKTLPVIVENLGNGDTPREFNIMTYQSDYASTILVTDTQESVLESAVFRRNVSIEQRLNVKIIIDESKDWYEIPNEVMIMSQSGEVAYDLYYNVTHLMLPLVNQGAYINAEKLDVIDYSQEWWDADIQKCLRISGDTYSLTGAANIQLYDSYTIMAYNNDMAKELQMPNFAELALSGNWTWDIMYQNTVKAYNDNDMIEGESYGDTFGFTTNQELMLSALICSGESIISYDNNNYPSFDGFSDRTVNIYDQICAWFYGRNETVVADFDVKYLGVDHNAFHDIFVDGNALFYREPVGSLEKLRNSDFEFTVLPVPKWNAEDEYITEVCRHAYTFYVPSTTTDLRSIGIFLDNLNYQSYKDVTPAYVEQIVTLQRVRNEASYSVLNEIVLVSEKKLPLIACYDWGKLNTRLLTAAGNGESLASVGASVKRGFKLWVEESLGEK